MGRPPTPPAPPTLPETPLQSGLFSDHPIVKRGGVRVINGDLVTGDQLAEIDGRWAIVTGTVDHVRKTKASRFIEFAPSRTRGAPYIGLKVKNLKDPAALEMDFLERLIGQKIAVFGRLDIQKKSLRYRIDLTERANLIIVSEK